MTSTTPLSHRALCRLATTNTPPSAQDAAIILETVEEIDRKLTQKAALLAVLEDEIQELERERKFFKPMLSPIRRMPLEIMGEIFVQALEQNSLRRTSLSRLCRVCKGWRDAAVSTPRLWQTTTLDLSAESPSYEAVSARINNARGLPRTLHIVLEECGTWSNDRDNCASSEGGKCCLTETVLFEVLRRVQLDKVTIRCPTPQCFRLLFAYLHTVTRSVNGPPHPPSWDCIKSVSLFWQSWRDEWENLQPKLLDVLPKSLKDFQVVLPPITQCPEDVIVEVNIAPIVLRRLTSINITSDWGSNCVFRMLRHCVNIESLTLNLERANFDWNLPHDAFVEEIMEHGLFLPKVRTVQIDGASAFSLYNLQHLKMPALSEFRISFGVDLFMPEVSADSRFAMDSMLGNVLGTLLRGKPGASPALRSLHITNGYFQSDALFNALQHLSSVENLTLCKAVFSHDTFAKLASRNALQNLKSLDLLQLHTNPTNLSGLRPFVEKCGIKLETTRCESAKCGICAG